MNGTVSYLATLLYDTVYYQYSEFDFEIPYEIQIQDLITFRQGFFLKDWLFNTSVSKSGASQTQIRLRVVCRKKWHLLPKKHNKKSLFWLFFIYFESNASRTITLSGLRPLFQILTICWN